MRGWVRLLGVGIAAGCSPAAVDDIGSQIQGLAGPIAAYGFDEGSGATTADRSGNGFTGALSNASWTAGRYGNAIQFNGTSSLVTVADAAALRLTTGLTLEAWVKPTSMASFPAIIFKMRPNEFAYALYGNASDGKPNVNYTYSNGTEVNLNAGTKPANGVWTHVAGTFNGSKLTMFVNGVQTGTMNASHAIQTSTNPLYFGGDPVWPGEWYSGAIDEIRIYNRALTQAEIQMDMSTPVVPQPDAGADSGLEASTDASQDVTSEPDANQVVTSEPDANQVVAPEQAADAAQEPATDAADAASEQASPSQAIVYPLKLAPGKRYLVDQNGTPFFMKGDSGWSVITTLTAADASTYFADRAAKGFNTIWIGMFDNIYAASSSGANAYGALPFTKALDGSAYTNAQTQDPDFAFPNEAYFAQVDVVVDLAASYDLLVLLSPSWLGYGGGGLSQEGYYHAMVRMPSTTLQGFGQYLGTRYANRPNIVWHHAGDYTPPNKTVVESFVTGLKLADTVHLNSIDTVDGTSPLDSWSSESWLDMNNVYTDQLIGYPSTHDKTKAEYQLGMPMFMKEGSYEGEHNASAQFIRSQAYVGVIGGGFGEIFGNSPIWYFGSGWQSAMSSRGSLDMAQLHAFFSARRWDLLAPDYTFAGSLARASDGSWAVAYVTGTVTVSASGNAYWFDPTSGAKTAVVNTGMFTPPPANAGGDHDWLLVFE